MKKLIQCVATYVVANFVAYGTADDFDYYTPISYPDFDVIPAYRKYYILYVKIFPDRTLEDNELFYVTAQPEHTPDRQPDCRVSVIIRDDDGKS